MLQPTDFYNAFGDCTVLDLAEHQTNPIDGAPQVLIDNVIVRAYESAILLMCSQASQDAFAWLHSQYQPLVFKSSSQHLSAVVLFDASTDQTAEAVDICQKLVAQLKA